MPQTLSHIHDYMSSLAVWAIPLTYRAVQASLCPRACNKIEINVPDYSIHQYMFVVPKSNVRPIKKNSPSTVKLKGLTINPLMSGTSSWQNPEALLALLQSLTKTRAMRKFQIFHYVAEERRTRLIYICQTSDYSTDRSGQATFATLRCVSDVVGVLRIDSRMLTLWRKRGTQQLQGTHNPVMTSSLSCCNLIFTHKNE